MGYPAGRARKLQHIVFIDRPAQVKGGLGGLAGFSDGLLDLVARGIIDIADGALARHRDHRRQVEVVVLDRGNVLVVVNDHVAIAIIIIILYTLAGILEIPEPGVGVIEPVCHFLKPVGAWKVFVLKITVKTNTNSELKFHGKKTRKRW